METTRSYRDGTLSLTIPDGFTEAPERESAQRPLVAVLSEWEGPDELRHEISVQVQEPTPQLATIAQLSAATVAAQIALGRHVAAVDVWPVPGDAPGRRVESVFPAPGLAHGLTVVELQYLTIRAGRCVTLAVRLGADRHAVLQELFTALTGSLVLDVAGVEVIPDPAALPPVDGFLADSDGEDPLEDLSEIRPRQPYTTDAHRLSPRDIDVLGGSFVLTHRGDHRAALSAAGFLTANGRRLTDAGKLARELLLRPSAEFHADVTEPGRIRLHRLHVRGRGWDALVQADASPWSPPGDARPGRSLELIPANEVACMAAGWLGLAPAWTHAVAGPDAEDGRVSVDRLVWDACLTDPSVPVPPGMSDAFTRVWSEPWQLVELRSTAIRRGPARVRVLLTGAMGNFVVANTANGSAVTLEPYSSAALLRLLLIFTGALELPAADAAADDDEAGA